MDAIDILFAGEEEDEGDDVTRAMERDANPTVDAGTSGGGASQKPDKREASMARRQAKGEKPPAKAGIEEVNEHQNMSPTKRECSPTSTVPGSKKVKGRTDVREQGRDGVLI